MSGSIEAPAGLGKATSVLLDPVEGPVQRAPTEPR